MICTTCRKKKAEPNRDECFRCRVSTVGITFVGGGGYGRRAFSERTTQEYLNEFCGGGPKENPNIAPLSDYVR